MTKPKSKTLHLTLDNTIQTAISTCETQTVLRYIWHLRPEIESPALKAGIDMHAALAHFVKSGGTDRDGAMKVFRRSYKSWAQEHVEDNDDYGPGHRLAYDNLSTILRSVISRLDVYTPLRLDPSLVEQGFSFPLTSTDYCACGHGMASHRNVRCSKCECEIYTDLDASGIIDVIANDGPRAIPVDWKTTYRIWPDWVREYKMASQITGYIWACQQLTGHEVTSAYIGAIETSKLPGSDKTCGEHKQPYAECREHHAKWQFFGPIERSDRAIIDWRRSALRNAVKFARLKAKYPEPDAKAVRTIPQSGQFLKEACKFCDFREFCYFGRRRAPFERFVEDRWNPKGREE